MISQLLDFVRTNFINYIQMFSGAVLSIFAVAYLFLHKCEHRYQRQISVLAGSLFVFGIFVSIFNFFGSADRIPFIVEDYYMVVPTTFILGYTVVAICSDLDKRKLLECYILFVTLLIVEASVPLQINIHTFIAQYDSVKTNDLVKEMADEIGDSSVLAPPELVIPLKTYNTNISILKELSTTECYSNNLFWEGAENSAKYIVINRYNNAGEDDTDTIVNIAKQYNYILQSKIDKYYIFESVEE